MHGHNLVLLQCWEGCVGDWRQGDGGREEGLSASIISDLWGVWRERAIMKMPGVKAISLSGPTSLWRAASYRSCFHATCSALQGYRAADREACWLVFKQTLWKKSSIFSEWDTSTNRYWKNHFIVIELLKHKNCQYYNMKTLKINVLVKNVKCILKSIVPQSCWSASAADFNPWFPGDLLPASKHLIKVLVVKGHCSL